MSDPLSLVPPLTRARGFHLYAPGNKRLLDLWRQDGRAFLGYRPAHWTLELKNQLSRGGVFGLPSPWQQRLEKLLTVSFPGWSGVRFFDHKEELFRFSGASGWFDPALGEEGEWMIHRPGLPLPEKAGLLWLRLPDGGLGPEILLSREKLPPGDPQSPFRLAAAHGALVALSQWGRRFDAAAWDSWNEPWFKRRGPYLEAGGNQEKFKACLEAGILVPPQDGKPWILPLEWSEGERKKIAGLGGGNEWT